MGKPRVKPTVLRNRTNRFWGAALVGIFAVGWLLGDPLMLFGVPADVPPADRIGPQDAAVISWALGVASALALALLWYPSVEVSEEEVTIKNPLLTTTILKRSISAVDDSKTYLRIVAGDKSYVCFGLEKSLAMAARNADDSSTAKAVAAIPGVPVSVNNETRRSVRPPTLVEVIIIIRWVSLGLVALIKR